MCHFRRSGEVRLDSGMLGDKLVDVVRVRVTDALGGC